MQSSVSPPDNILLRGRGKNEKLTFSLKTSYENPFELKQVLVKITIYIS